VRQQARYLFFVEEEEREGSEGRMWLPTLVGYCTNRCDHSIKTFLSVFQELKRDSFLFFPYFICIFYFQIAMDEKLSWNSRGTEIVQLIISVHMDFQVTPSLSLFLPHDNKLYFL
jgi:hypothetical protein